MDLCADGVHGHGPEQGGAVMPRLSFSDDEIVRATTRCKTPLMDEEAALIDCEKVLDAVEDSLKRCDSMSKGMSEQGTGLPHSQGVGVADGSDAPVAPPAGQGSGVCSGTSSLGDASPAAPADEEQQRSMLQRVMRSRLRLRRLLDQRAARALAAASSKADESSGDGGKRRAEGGGDRGKRREDGVQGGVVARADSFMLETLSASTGGSAQRDNAICAPSALAPTGTWMGRKSRSVSWDDLPNKLLREHTVRLTRRVFTGREDTRVRDFVKMPRVVRKMDKYSFTSGVIGICLTEFVMLIHERLFRYYYCALIFPLLAMRVYLYRQNRWHYFLFDFCYFVNMLGFLLALTPIGTYPVSFDTIIGLF